MSSLHTCSPSKHNCYLIILSSTLTSIPPLPPLSAPPAHTHTAPVIDGPKHSILHIRRKRHEGDETGSGSGGTGTGSGDGASGGGVNAVGGSSGPDPTTTTTINTTTATTSSNTSSTDEWFMFNDFVLQPSHLTAAVTFPDWRHPSALFFVREGYTEGYEKFKKEIQIATAMMDNREKSLTGE